MSFETRDYKLDNSTIQQAVTDIEPFLAQEKVDKKNALRLRFSLEELLLRIQDSDTAPGTFLPDAVREGLNNYLLTPMFETFLGIVNTMAGIIIFLAVSSGVFGIGNTSALSRIGKVMFPRYLITVFISSIITVLIALSFCPLRMSSAVMGESQLGKISNMIFDILPKNLVRPFLDGNMMQVIVMAVFTGVILLVMGERSSRITALIEDLGSVTQYMMEIICRLIPLFVFTSLLSQIWSGSAREIFGLWKPFLIFLLVNLLVTALVLLLTAFQTKTSPVLLLKKVLPSALIAFSTASSMAAFTTSESDCVEKMGISKKLFDFSFPIGMVVYMPGLTVELAAVPIYLAELHALEVDTAWLIMCVILAAVLSIAAPPMPGSSVACYGILLAQLGIPMESMLMVIALDIVMDFFCSGMDNLRLQLDLACQANTLHMLDRKKLEAR